MRKENQQSRQNLGGGRGAPPHILADMLSLFQSEWVQIIPTTLLLVPPPGFSDLPTALLRERKVDLLGL